MNLVKIKEIAKIQGKTLGSVASAVGLTAPGLDYIIKENNTKVDVANRKLIDLINKRAAGDEHNTDGQNSDAI